MKTKIKKALSLALASALTIAMMAGCSNNSSSTASEQTTSKTADVASDAPKGFTVTMDPAGYPVCSEKINVKFLLGFQFPNGTPLWETPNDIPFYKEYEEKTNIHIDWEIVARADYKQRFNLMISGDDLPDAFMKTSKISNADLIQNGQAGTIIDIAPYMETYAPDLNKYLNDNKLMSSMKVGGGIWGFPYIFDSDGITISKIFFHTDWLKRVNMPMPKTVDEITNTLRAFKKVAAADEMPMALYGASDFYGWFGSTFGLANRGNSNANIDADPADPSGKTVRFWRSSDGAKELLRMEKQYYAEGLIPQNVFNTADATTAMNNALRVGKAGAHDLWTTVAGPEAIDKYITMDAPPATKDGKTPWNNVVGKIGSRSGFLISKKCEHPEALVGWCNYFFTQQGAFDYFLGQKDVSYTVDDKGNTQLTDLITKNPDGLSQAQAQYKFSLAGGGGNAGLATDQTFKGGETYWTSLDGNPKFKPFIPETVWESFPMTADQASAVAGVSGDIDALITEYESKFITGVLDLDKDWPEYLKKLDTAGLPTLVKAHNDALAAMN